jgi:hypothetical protein
LTVNASKQSLIAFRIVMAFQKRDPSLRGLIPAPRLVISFDRSLMGVSNEKHPFREYHYGLGCGMLVIALRDGAEEALCCEE